MSPTLLRVQSLVLAVAIGVALILFSRPLIEALAADPDLVVGDNQPYKGSLEGDCLWQHATRRSLPHALIEYRQDLVRDAAKRVLDRHAGFAADQQQIERIRERIPDLPAILTSGYAQPARLPDVEFLQKPFLPKMLAEAIERLLGERSA